MCYKLGEQLIDINKKPFEFSLNKNNLVFLWIYLAGKTISLFALHFATAFAGWQPQCNSGLVIKLC
jgi:hypothetical protein